MNTPSPFAEVLAIQEEQREGWMPDYQQQLAEKDAQIVALREALGKVAGYGRADMGHQQMCDYVTEVADAALSTPPPPVVPLEHAMWLYNALELKECFGHPANCLVAFQQLHLEASTTKYPQP